MRVPLPNFKLRGFLVAALVLLLVSSVGIILSERLVSTLNRIVVERREATRPASLTVTVIEPENCQRCAATQPLVDLIRAQPVSVAGVTTLTATDPQASDLLTTYRLDRTPALIVGGEINKDQKLQQLWQSYGQYADDAVVIYPVGVYVETAGQKVRGEVSVTLLTDRRCETCYDVGINQPILRRFGVPLDQSSVLDVGSDEGQKLVRDFRILSVPTFVIRGDTEIYQALKAVWPQVGTTEPDGTMVFRNGVTQMGTYRDLVKGQVITASTPPASAPPAAAR